MMKSAYLPGNAWKGALLESGYGAWMAEEAGERIKSLLGERKISSESIEELVSEETLYVEYGYCVDDIWNRREQNRREQWEEKLAGQLEEYLKQRKAAVTEQLEAEMEKLVKEAGGIYDSFLNPEWLSDMLLFADKWERPLAAAIFAAAVTAAVCVWLLWQLYHYKHRAIRYVCYSTISSLVWGICLNLYLGRTEWLMQAGIEPAKYRQLLQELGKIGMRSGFLMIGIELLLLFLLAICMKHLKHREY